jgi:16S rRNA (adenine1518-N6/adenine1519-N6)-dimethyltransferase
MRAKKSFGQHFLRHPDLAARIVDALDMPGTEGRVLEVGPGKGILTKFLAERYPGFKAIDADRDMIQRLLATYPQWEDRLLLGDFLQWDLVAVFEGKPFSLIGNFPYNISSQILISVLAHRDLIPEMVGMFQREVARRIVSGPGSKEYGILSVLTQAFFHGRYLFSVSRDAFDPPPKVESGVIRLERKDIIDPVFEYPFFTTLVKTAFNQRRKMLRNSLRSLKEGPLPDHPLMDRRPEQLGLEDFRELVLRLHSSD